MPLAQVLLSRSLLLQLAGADITAANTPESPEPTGQEDTKLSLSIGVCWDLFNRYKIDKIRKTNKKILLGLATLLISKYHTVFMNGVFIYSVGKQNNDHFTNAPN